jgi:hypothetical protein
VEVVVVGVGQRHLVNPRSVPIGLAAEQWNSGFGHVADRAADDAKANGGEGMAPLLTACSGFLFAVLWMDLIFDSQIFGHRSDGAELPEPILASVAGYYHRATTTSRPMSRLIALVMLILLGALGFQATLAQDPGWLLVVSAGLAGIPTMLALTQTVPDAVRLGHRDDNPAEQTRLARSVCRDHLVCAACMFSFLLLWLVHALAT